VENTSKLFDRVAHLARLGPYEPKMGEHLGQDFARILDLFKVLEQLTANKETKPSWAAGPCNAFREDESRAFKNREAIVANFPAKESSYLKVPRVIE